MFHKKHKNGGYSSNNEGCNYTSILLQKPALVFNFKYREKMKIVICEYEKTCITLDPGQICHAGIFIYFLSYFSFKTKSKTALLSISSLDIHSSLPTMQTTQSLQTIQITVCHSKYPSRQHVSIFCKNSLP